MIDIRAFGEDNERGVYARECGSACLAEQRRMRLVTPSRQHPHPIRATTPIRIGCSPYPSSCFHYCVFTSLPLAVVFVSRSCLSFGCPRAWQHNAVAFLLR
ncbi:unnamed protein product, partial [Ectocarpus sp. 4 AP-2014]